MRVALCQIDPTVGDFAGNRDRILAAAADARARGARLAVFPELAVCGYPAEDLLLRSDFLSANDQSLRAITAALPPDLSILVGCLERNDDGVVGRDLWNGVALIEDGLCRVVARKSLLPTYDVFDEARYFEPWPDPRRNVVEIGGRRFGITICEDAWNDAEFFDERLYGVDPVAELVAEGVDTIVNLAASPWDRRRLDDEPKDRFRMRMMRAAAERHGLRFLFVNQVGANVGVLFDGGSCGVSATGVAHQPTCFRETVEVVDLDEDWTLEPKMPAIENLQTTALTTGLRCYADKFGIDRAFLGLSGGIDSALTAALAADALGPDRVVGVAMPSRYSSQHSLDDARRLAEMLGLEFHEVQIDPMHKAFEEALEPHDAAGGLAGENLQSRIRGTALMAFANARGGMTLATGNKSELAVGYCTLYGDTNGALAPLGDLWKTEVWALSRHLNKGGERIPVSSIEKPPSAELRPDQFDTDSLLPYERLDAVLKRLVERLQDCGTVASETGESIETVREIFGLVVRNEFKRFQVPPALRVSERSWVGRRMPVSHRFVSER